MLKQRLVSSTILISVVGLCVWLDAAYPLFGVDGIWLLPLLLFFAFATAWEMSGLLDRARIPVRRRVAVFGAILPIVGAAIPLLWPLCGDTYPASCPVGRVGWIAVATAIAVGTAFLQEMRDYRKKDETTEPGRVAMSLASTVLVSVYVGTLLSFLVLTRGIHEGARGVYAVVGLVWITKCGDIGAYAAGKCFGRRKLIPRISPGKTWEGLIGGIGLCVLVSYLWFGELFETPAEAPCCVWSPAIFGVVLALLGLAGDLAESLIKRDTGQKDSGGLLPGMGGIWDVTDSLIGTSVAGYLMIAAGWVG